MYNNIYIYITIYIYETSNPSNFAYWCTNPSRFFLNNGNTRAM